MDTEDTFTKTKMNNKWNVRFPPNILLNIQYPYSSEFLFVRRTPEITLLIRWKPAPSICFCFFVCIYICIYIYISSLSSNLTLRIRKQEKVILSFACWVKGVTYSDNSELCQKYCWSKSNESGSMVVFFQIDIHSSGWSLNLKTW